jgi:hypothetical protein
LETYDQGALPPWLRLLKGLVIALLAVMICAVITVVWLLVTRMPEGRAQIPPLPGALTLPPGAVAQAVTYGEGLILVLTRAGEVLVYSLDGQLQRSLTLHPAP